MPQFDALTEIDSLGQFAIPSEVPLPVVHAIHAVEEDNSALIDEAMSRLIEEANQLGLPRPFLSDIQQCSRTGGWSKFARALQTLDFLGADGRFFLLAPYTTSRKAKTETVLSAIYGSRLNLGEIPAILPILLDLFGVVHEKVPQIVPIMAHAGAGWFAGESGEAFIVPNGWAGLPEGDGPVFNNMSEQLNRVKVAFEAISRIFDETSASLLLSVYTPQSRLMTTLNAEYSFHEGGHASGIGLNHKFAAGVLNSTFYGAVEEWRSDGVAFETARRALPLETVGTLIASNVITRFGIDAHRSGALHLDTDVNSALLMFHSLIESGMLRVHPNKRLGFVDATFPGLARATEMMSASAISLTRRELQLPDPHAIWTLYPSVISVPQSVRQLFQQTVIDPCLGLYRELR
jgi:hypothetical protein